MKKLNLKIAFLLIVTGLLISCKKNNANTEDYNDVDSTEITVDTVGPLTDTTNNSGAATGAGTTGATGEGSTGSGSAGTTQQGNTSVRTDSSATAPR